MGATGWRYRVDFHADAEEALQGLRREVFNAKRYPFKEPWPKALRRKLFLIWLVSQVFEGLRRFILKARIGGASSIDHLIERAGEAGTHSIIDITHVAPRPEFGVASPAPDGLLMDTFNTTQPTLEDYESYVRGETWADDIAEGLGRWQAFYFPLYENGEPRWLCFEGYSGD